MTDAANIEKEIIKLKITYVSRAQAVSFAGRPTD